MKKVYSLLAAFLLVSSFAFAQVTQQWASIYDSPINNSDVAYAMVADGSGNTYVTGASFTGANYDIVTIKYNSLGAQQWLVSYNGPTNASDVPSAITIDASGNIYIAGTSNTGGTSD